MSGDSFGARSQLEVGGREYEIYRLDALQERFDVARLPYSLKVLLENVLRLEDGDVGHRRRRRGDRDLGRQGRAQRRDPLPAGAGADAGLHRRPRGRRPGGDARRDGRARRRRRRRSTRSSTSTWSSTTRSRSTRSATPRAFAINAEREFERNRERYAFLRWGQEAFDNFRVVPPATGICHQVNLEYIAQVVCSRERDGALARLSRHPGRHRLAHDDGQRPRRARLGRRRDRGRGGDARPADLDAAAAGDRLQARRRALGGRRPRPTWC